MVTIISLDFYNLSFSISINGHTHFWNSKEEFITDTQFPYGETVKLLSYEPSRNLFIVERDLGETLSGTDVEEIDWFTQHLDSLEQLLIQKEIENTIVVTLEMDRFPRLAMTDWVIQRHQEETILNIPHKLTEEQLVAVLEYRQQLRDLTNTYSKDTPTEEVVWPINPLD